MKTAKTVSQEYGFLPSPSIVAIAGLGNKVGITFRPGEPEDQTSKFLVIRSMSPTGPGVQLGHPIPADTRK